MTLWFIAASILVYKLEWRTKKEVVASVRGLIWDTIPVNLGHWGKLRKSQPGSRFTGRDLSPGPQNVVICSDGKWTDVLSPPRAPYCTCHSVSKDVMTPACRYRLAILSFHCCLAQGALTVVCTRTLSEVETKQEGQLSWYVASGGAWVRSQWEILCIVLVTFHRLQRAESFSKSQ
jgi:hypothetical protein